MYTVGIDPGKTGAVTIIDENGNVKQKHVIPLIAKEFDIREFSCLLDDSYRWDRWMYHVFIEDVHAIYGAAAGSTFTFGFICGAIRGVVTSLGFMFTLVQPKVWQKEIYQGIPEIRKPSIIIKTGKKAGQSRRGARDTKAMSLLAAKRLFPNTDFRKNTHCKIPHDGIVDALLIAEYGRRLLNKT